MKSKAYYYEYGQERDFKLAAEILFADIVFWIIVGTALWFLT